MKNCYEIRGDHAVIFVQEARGREFHEALVGLAGLVRAQEYPHKWRYRSVSPKRARRSCYVVGQIVNPRSFFDAAPKRVFMLHRFVIGCPDGMVVDHINGDTLDCREGNLRVCSYSMNSLNRAGSFSRTGLPRGVTPNRSGRTFSAKIRMNHQTIRFGSFDTPQKAALAVCKALREYDPVSAERYAQTNGISEGVTYA